ncbi:unnamed protein product [marine sediment metagenome]|uniref:Uncharacterized protein n=1 Tax=marine sediment metagenome TaxID=412755 RepID=X1V8V2_9ZZZZ
MLALYVYLGLCYLLAILISLTYEIFADRLEERGWKRPSMLDHLISIILAPITVPWWVVCFIIANNKRG